MAASEGSETPSILLNPENKEIHAAVGRAIEAYANAEGAQSSILQAILKVKPHPAAIIFYAVQNVRGRNAMMQSLLISIYGDTYRPFWKKVSAFLEKMATFRNALVHWTPGVVLYKSKAGKGFVGYDYELIHPTSGGKSQTINADDIEPFIKDCRYITQELFALNRHLAETESDEASRQRFLTPNLRPNLAVLGQPRTPKEQQPPQQPSEA